MFIFAHFSRDQDLKTRTSFLIFLRDLQSPVNGTWSNPTCGITTRQLEVKLLSSPHLIEVSPF